MDESGTACFEGLKASERPVAPLLGGFVTKGGSRCARVGGFLFYRCPFWLP